METRTKWNLFHFVFTPPLQSCNLKQFPALLGHLAFSRPAARSELRYKRSDIAVRKDLEIRHRP